MTERTVFAGPSDAGPTPRTVMAAESVPEGYRRLALVTAVLFGAILVVLAVWFLEFLGGTSRSAWELTGTLVMATACAAVAIGSRRRIFPARAFVPIALAAEIVIAAGLSAPILGWQHRLGPDALAWLVGGDLPPFDLGAGQVPWAGLWVVLFATVIPLRPPLHLLGAALSTVPLLAWPFVSIAALGTPAEMEGNAGEYTLHIGVWLFFRGALAAGMAYFLSRSVYGLRKNLARARTMGSYHLREKLGEGGMGEVWLADHHMLARSAAIKLIKPERDGSRSSWEELTRRFRREVRSAAQLRSPHTIEVYDYGVTEAGTFYYVMELLDGLDLEELVRSQGPLPWRRVVHLLIQACHSLGEAHERGLVHRDVKPANIFLCRVGRDLDRVKVLDFGLVKTAGPAVEDTGLTREGTYVGTPAYTAPEIASAGAEGASPRSDLYSLGCVAFWLLTGKRVFRAETPLDMLIRHASEEPSPPSEVSELEVPPELDRLVLDCLAKDPGSRPGSADAMAERLREIEAGRAWTAEEAVRWWARQSIGRGSDAGEAGTPAGSGT